MKELSQIDYKSKAKELKTIILRNGGCVPSKRELLPSKKQEMIGKVKKNVWYGDKHINKTKTPPQIGTEKNTVNRPIGKELTLPCP